MNRDMAFDHDVATRFELEGAHGTVACVSCHLDNVFSEPRVDPSECSSCHFDVHLDAFAQPCTACHTTSSFHDLLPEEVHARTAFPLTGAHLQTSCEACHQQESRGPFSTMDPGCEACHMEEYVTAAGVDHDVLGFSQDCTQCHNTIAWASTPAFEHTAFANGFTLLGAHEQAPCTSCHIVPGLDTFHSPMDQDDCVACHQAEFNAEHLSDGYPSDCQFCHTTSDWSGVFDHGVSGNGFELLGAHARVQCATCHTLPDMGTVVPVTDNLDCVTCHQAQYDANHPGSGFSTQCLDCHTTETWVGPDFDHLATSGFPLVGPHEPLLCSTCHNPTDNSLLFAPPPAGQNDCVACHQSDYDATHAGSGFSTSCLDCHAPNTWEGASFDHATTGFSLIGAHQPLLCAACHNPADNSLLFSPPPTGQNDCVACHQSDYNANHQGSGFSTQCTDCHTTSTWQGANFDHATTGFSLVGAHQPLLCAACHNPADNSLLFSPPPTGPNDCVACHQSDYNANHQGSGFSTSCLDCHTTSTWQGATFDHSTTGFSLVGAHQPLLCAACHNPADNSLLFSPPPAGQNDCVACHQSDYNANHQGSGFSTSCLDCHTTSTWDGATFDHNAYFPIYSGAHRQSIWGECSTCHTNPQDFSVFTCLSCHEHSRTQTDNDHSEVSGYTYESTACYSCHSNGQS